jgi:hypothetical protein
MARPSPISPIQPAHRIVGNSTRIGAWRAQSCHMAPSYAVGHPYVPTVVLHGETWMRKGLVARIPRNEAPFLDLDQA